MDNHLAKQKERVIQALFEYVFFLRVKRKPYAWEVVLGMAIAAGTMKVIRPSNNGALRMVQMVADDVSLALAMPELLEEVK